MNSKDQDKHQPYNLEFGGIPTSHPDFQKEVRLELSEEELKKLRERTQEPKSPYLQYPIF